MAERPSELSLAGHPRVGLGPGCCTLVESARVAAVGRVALTRKVDLRGYRDREIADARSPGTYGSSLGGEGLPHHLGDLSKERALLPGTRDPLCRCIVSRGVPQRLGLSDDLVPPNLVPYPFHLPELHVELVLGQI